jgi:Family of unknown function (DUF6527)
MAGLSPGWRWRVTPPRWRTWRAINAVPSADQVPKRIPRRGAVLVGDRSRPTWIAFDCPCPQRHRVLLNLDIRRRPYWTLRDGAALTLHPSIDEARPDNRCHYHLRHGRVGWVSNP